MNDFGNKFAKHLHTYKIMGFLNRETAKERNDEILDFFALSYFRTFAIDFPSDLSRGGDFRIATASAGIR